MLRSRSLLIFLFLTVSCRHTPERALQSLASNEIPAACFSFSANTSFQNSTGIDSRFSSCKDDKSAIVRGAKKPQLPDSYFQDLASHFNLVSSCLGIRDAKVFVPKFAGESGFYPNALGPYGELGIGQLTQAAINDINPMLGRIRSEFQNSEMPACKDLAEQDSYWSSVSYKFGCEVSTANTAKKNILLSLLYNRLLQNWISSDLKKFEIQTRLATLGLQQTTSEKMNQNSWTLEQNLYHREDLIGILTAVSYNAGARGVTQYLRNYLNQRIEAKSPVSKSDFNFKNDLSWINALSPKQQKEIPISKISFPAYLKLFQEWGHPGYGPDMMKLIYKLNEGVGFHICTPERIEGFLAL